jgi:hypothetical protein
MRILKLLIWTIILFPLGAMAQTGAVQNHCFLGGKQAIVSGMNSTNYSDGIVPACTVTVYLTGTTTKATIYADVLSTPLANPFTANIVASVNPGGWIFWAATNVGLDVVMSGGGSNPSCTTGPNCYTSPVTLTDVFPSQSFTPVSGVTAITPGTNITCSPLVSGSCTGGVTINSSGGGGGGVTSLNSLTGALNITGDSSITVSPSGSNIALHATGASGGGVLYNPTTTVYFVTSFSGLYNDSDSSSRLIGVPSSVSCTGTGPSTCTVAMTAHGFTVTTNAVDMSNLASWPASPAGAVQQSAQYGSFQITTIPDANHFTFTTPTVLSYSCSPCTGNLYDASLWGIWHMAAEPYFFGHGTVYGIETSTQSAVAGLATWIGGITGTPKYLIDQSGQNDLAAGRTASQVEADHQTLWAIAHTAGMTVVQTTMVPAQYGLSFGATVSPSQINRFYWENYGPTTTTLANGQYIDQYIDTAMAYRDQAATITLPDPRVTRIFGQKLNAVLSNQDSNPTDSPNNTYYSFTSVAGNYVPMHHTNTYEYFSDSSDNLWMAWIANGIGSNTQRGLNLYATGIYPMYHNISNLGAGTDWPGEQMGSDLTSNNNSFLRGFHDVSSGSTSNYFFLRPYGGSDALRVGADGSITIPALTSQSTIGTDSSGKLVTGTGGGGGAVPTVIDTTTPVTVSTTNVAEYHNNQNATAATAITYNLPTASAGKQFCFTNSYNGSAADTGTLTLQTSASGQFIIFTDGTLSASNGYVISGGAASDAACVVGVDTTHWQLYTQRGTWTKH